MGQLLPPSSAVQLVLCACRIQVNRSPHPKQRRAGSREEGRGWDAEELLEEESREMQESLKAHAAKYLPEWMRPSCYLILRKMPRLAAGKVDREALRSAIQSLVGRLHRGVVSHSSSSLHSEAMCVLREEMSSLLPLFAGSVCEDMPFVELGGSSVIATRLCVRLRRRGWLLHPELLMQPHSSALVASEAMRRSPTCTSPYAATASAAIY